MAAKTVIRVIVRGEHKRRRKGQLSLFAAERLIVTRTYNEDGRLIGYNARKLGHTTR